MNNLVVRLCFIFFYISMFKYIYMFKNNNNNYLEILLDNFFVRKKSE